MSSRNVCPALVCSMQIVAIWQSLIVPASITSRLAASSADGSHPGNCFKVTSKPAPTVHLHRNCFTIAHSLSLIFVTESDQISFLMVERESFTRRCSCLLPWLPNPRMMLLLIFSWRTFATGRTRGPIARFNIRRTVESFEGRR